MSDNAPTSLEPAQADARFFYPAVTDEELVSPAVLQQNYRRLMGRYRMVLAGLSAFGLLIVYRFVRGAEKRR